MGKFFAPVVVSGLFAMACSDSHRPVLFTAPGRASAPSPTPPSPFAFAFPRVSLSVF